ncbi:coniferyl aldehyde dehydrogenase [Thalassotalea sp. LPB0316]|uniref:coniferyl aldehyde dehydrogenase n=1 Tax=Thalassotalea sp. LPB0316 TaxID=2769490 RepID=UPI0018667C35|nr:coniferyl aldehyde dehydrogenase [Thalassotalea sp. LPB0316]QOL26338.1 coniferyl aldehyde dehydrogenase [Thalassotalea sp. LPB0316]
MEDNQELQQLDHILDQQKVAFNANPYPEYQARINDLDTLKSLVLDNQDALVSAMNEDFGNRSVDDSKIGDILTTVAGIHYAKKQLKKWMKPQKRHVGILFQPASARVEYQPLGVVGIMVPWNYPIFLALGPLTTALAAGNRAMIKMSEFTPKTTQVLAQLVSQYFSQDKVAIIDGDASVAAKFSALNFDHLFFTGSTNVGKLVMRAAAENLVPVTLELGGKSPAIIAPDMPIKTAVARLMLGKTLNSGQTCVAPDYLFVPRGKSRETVQELQQLFAKMFPAIDNNQDYTSVVNDGQYQRLVGLVEDAKAKGAVVTELNQNPNCNKTRQLPLTVLEQVTEDMTVMQQEIFGPLLPIMEYDDVNDAIAYIQRHERPLALYIYSFNKQTQQHILANTHSGGVCINEAAFHVAVEDLPFGGVGHSGMGNYHGIEGFKTFSHAKAILSRGKISLTSLLFPPYGTALHNLVYKLFIK